MERKGLLRMLVVSARKNLHDVDLVIEELNRGARQATFPHTLERCFRTVEHDARVAGLGRLARALEHAKAASRKVMDPAQGREVVEALATASSEFQRAADHLDQGVAHELDPGVVGTLERLARDSEPGLR